MLRPVGLLLVLSLSPLAAAQSVTFAKQAIAPGDTIEQSVRIEMQLDQTGRRGKEVVEQTQLTQDREQRRSVTATRLEAGRVVEAVVGFSAASTTHNGRSIVEPVVGKRYTCRRDGESLVITAADGTVPPLPEYKLVSRAMATLGTESALAGFLAGRTVAVGERLELPAELAQKALGFDRSLGEVTRFGLQLKSIDETSPGSTARFDAEIEAIGAGSNQMGLIVGGSFQIEATSCRVVSADLSGPIGMSVVVGGYTVDAKGRMRLAIASQYHDVR